MTSLSLLTGRTVVPKLLASWVFFLFLSLLQHFNSVAYILVFSYLFAKAITPKTRQLTSLAKTDLPAPQVTIKAVFSEENYVPSIAIRVGKHAYCSLLCHNDPSTIFQGRAWANTILVKLRNCKVLWLP